MTVTSKFTGFLAAEGFLAQMQRELPRPFAQYERLLLFRDGGPTPRSFWAQNTWHDVSISAFSSIAEAARLLRAHGRNWCLLPVSHHRRAQLIQQQLPHLSQKPIVFGSSARRSALGSWSLIDANTMVFSANTSSIYPHGEAQFVENHDDPPSRAYLKLWELFTTLDLKPKEGSRCIELGAAPGGWTWVLAEFCKAHVIGIDRAPLAPRLMQNSLVHYQQGDAFGVDPKNYAAQPLDWFFSDLICYPEKLFQTISKWLDADACKNFVCTLKFQGEEHYNIIESFAKIPGSQLAHLSHNKHELTWWLIRDATKAQKLDLKHQL